MFAFTCCTGNRGSSNWPTALQQTCVELNRGSARGDGALTGLTGLSTRGSACSQAPWLPALSRGATLFYTCIEKLSATTFTNISSCTG